MRIVDIIYFVFLLTLSLDPTGFHSRLKDLLFVVLVVYGVIYCLKRRQYLAGINRVTLAAVILIPIWGMFIAAIYMISDNLLLVIIIHAVWDIWIRIPQFYFNMSEKATVLYSIGEILRFIIHPFVLGIMAILIAMYAKRVKHNE